MKYNDNSSYVEFIKYSIGVGTDIPVSAKCIDWNDFLQFCNRQGVIGLVYGTLERGGMKIPQQCLFQWLAFAENIKRQNAIVNKRISQCATFFEEKGCRSIVMKGQANGLMYPKPELRSPGDIDIWIEGARKDVINMVLDITPNAHYSIHHIKMPIFKDVSVEVHYRPIFLTNWFKDRKLQQYIASIEERQFSHHQPLGDIEIGTLTEDFDVIYQLLHMWHHFFETRNNFKQFIDYYYLLKKGHVNSTDVVNHLKIFGVLQYAKGIMWVMKEILGLEEKYVYTEPDEILGKQILAESMRFGTFSHNKPRQVFQQLTGNFRLVKYFPSEVLISPLFLIWHQLWKLKIKWDLRK